MMASWEPEWFDSLDTAAVRRLLRRLHSRSPASLALEAVPEGGPEALAMAVTVVRLRQRCLTVLKEAS